MLNHLPKKLTFRDSFLFPIRTPEARKDILLGGLAVIFLLPVGWILNLGARLNVVNRLYEGNKPYFRGMKPLSHTFRRGCISAATIFSYLLPANIFWGSAMWIYLMNGWQTYLTFFLGIGFLFFVLGVFTLPGCMTVYACEQDPSVLFNPYKAFQRAWSHRKIYLKAWAIALCSVVISFAGLFLFFFGFFFTSVWAWEVVGYAFTIAMYSNPVEDV